MKTTSISVRFSEDELATIDKIAAGLKVTRSDFLRKCALSGDRLSSSSEIKEELAEIKKMLNALVTLLEEHVRIPSFREWRVRVAIDKMLVVDEKTNLDDFLLNAARMYYARFGIWPKPNDGEKFGTPPEGPWPKNPV